MCGIAWHSPWAHATAMSPGSQQCRMPVLRRCCLDGTVDLNGVLLVCRDFYAHMGCTYIYIYTFLHRYDYICIYTHAHVIHISLCLYIYI